MKRLTALAFVFIPLSAVSSVYGMNIAEFGSEGGPPAWTFALTAVLIIASAVSLPGIDTIRRIWSRLEEIAKEITRAIDNTSPPDMETSTDRTVSRWEYRGAKLYLFVARWVEVIFWPVRKLLAGIARIRAFADAGPSEDRGKYA